MSTVPALFAAYADHLEGGAPPGDDEKPRVAKADVFNGRVGDITQMWLSDSERSECFLTGQVATSEDSISKRFGAYSVLLRRNVYPEKSQRNPELQLEIQSKALCEVLRGIAPHLRTVNMNATPIIVKAPYHELHHFRQEIIESVVDVDDVLAKEINELIKFLDDSLGKAVMGEIEALKAVRKMSMDHLWSIYKPGELVFLRKVGLGPEPEICCGVIQSFFTLQTAQGEPRWSVKVRHMSFEGGRLGVVEKDYQFVPFTGQMEIANLPALPLSYAEGGSRITEQLCERGRKYIRLCTRPDGSTAPVHKSYHGPVWIQRETWKADGCDFFDDPERIISGRVMVDPIGYVSEHSIFRSVIVSHSLREPHAFPEGDAGDSSKPLWTLEALDPTKLTSEELMTFPSRIGGYSLVTKDAGFFQIDGFTDIAWDVERANTLCSSNPRMSTTLRIASGFSFYTGLFGYENKGAGLTFLLYGPSGVGKTLTAECVAEALRLPLYRVSGSEIGTGVWEVERRLTKAFSRTARWSAILLFDEAETFMAKRSDESLERNAMVSCLLRLLEYHTGIVILTTNRIIDFDAAFHSRIHVSLEYKALSEAEKMAVWRKEVAGRVGSAHCISDEDFTALARLDLDGRTIHNVVHVLKMYMQGEKGIVSLSHVKEILRVATGKLQGEGRRQVEEFCG